MAKISRDQVIAKLKELKVDFNEGAQYEFLCGLLRDKMAKIEAEKKSEETTTDETAKKAGKKLTPRQARIELLKVRISRDVHPADRRAAWRNELVRLEALEAAEK